MLDIGAATHHVACLHVHEQIYAALIDCNARHGFLQDIALQAMGMTMPSAIAIA